MCLLTKAVEGLNASSSKHLLSTGPHMQHSTNINILAGASFYFQTSQ